MHELAERWQRARAELAKLMEARETRQEQARAARAMAPPPPTAASQMKKDRRPIKEEDLDEYLDDDDDVTTKKDPVPSSTTSSSVKEIPLPPPPPSWPLNLAATPTVAIVPPATVFPAKQSATVTPTSVTLLQQQQAFKPAVLPIATPTTSAPRPSSFLAALAPQTFGGTVITTPQEVTVAPADSSPMSSRQKKKERKTKVKEEELDEYLDDDEPTVSSRATVSSTVAAPKSTVTPKATVELKREIKKEEEPTVDPLNDSAIDLSLLDEVCATPARKITVAARRPSIDTIKKNTVITIDEGEDEWLDEEEDTVDLKRSATDCSSSSSQAPPPPAVAQKRVKIDEIEYIDLTEDELLAGAGDVIDITPEMEEELLRG